MKCKKVLFGALILSSSMAFAGTALAANSSLYVGYSTKTFYTFALQCPNAPTISVSGDASTGQSSSNLASQYGNRTCKLTLGTGTAIYTLAQFYLKNVNGILTIKPGSYKVLPYGKPGAKVGGVSVKSLKTSYSRGNVSFILTDSSSPF